jgi:lysophospholipase L1-like esterase
VKEILCFGDSNTWGWDPETKERFDAAVRWPGVLMKELGSGCHVIEEGLNGRTTVWEDPIEGFKKGSDHLPFLLETHRPLDLVLIMLGTNDLKMRFSLSAYDIAKGIGTLVEIVLGSGSGRDGGSPKILIVSPPPLGKLSEYAEMFQGGAEKSGRFAIRYAETAQEYACEFFDSSTVIQTSDIDGVHLEKKAHAALGRAVAAKVKKIMSE